jgi:acyl carrier protein
MQSQDVMTDVDRIIKEVLRQPQVTIDSNTTAEDVPNWDSLSNVEIVLAIEQGFNVRFTTREIQSFKNVGHICETIARKRNG